MTNLSKETAFLERAFELFPEASDSREMTAKQILEVRSSGISVPGSIWENKVANSKPALYVIPGGSVSKPVADPVAVDTVSTPSTKSSAVSTTVDKNSLVPCVDPNYVPFGNYRDLQIIVKSGMFYPSYIAGPTGNGKSTSIEQICAKQKKPLIRVNLNTMTDEDQLIGSKTLVDGNVEIVEGPIVIAMRFGIPLLLDEIDAGGANTLLCLQPILEGKPFYFKLKNEMITPAPGFNIFATANTKGKGSDDGRYIGTNVLNEAFLERFAVTFNQPYPTEKVELEIVKNLFVHFGLADQKKTINQSKSLDDFASNLVKWAAVVRKTFDDGGCDENITTRRLTHIVRAFSIFKNEKKAIELCLNRFDDVTKMAFLDLYTKISAGEMDSPAEEDSDRNPFTEEVSE
jgi:hypothetical protein|tara:strand:- start:468 stop:1673 length:1206 start_codon:yes stop_codon:yes gene_type:complete